jgi:hypothetical protein
VGTGFASRLCGKKIQSPQKWEPVLRQGFAARKSKARKSGNRFCDQALRQENPKPAKGRTGFAIRLCGKKIQSPQKGGPVLRSGFATQDDAQRTACGAWD